MIKDFHDDNAKLSARQHKLNHYKKSNPVKSRVD